MAKVIFKRFCGRCGKCYKTTAKSGRYCDACKKPSGCGGKHFGNEVFDDE